MVFNRRARNFLACPDSHEILTSTALQKFKLTTFYFVLLNLLSRHIGTVPLNWELHRQLKGFNKTGRVQIT